MKKHLLVSLFTISFTLFSSQSFAQVITTSNNTASTLVNNLVGSGVIVLSSSLTCANGGAGTFTTTGACNMGLGTGIVLTSGNVSFASGPNNSSSAGVDNAGGGYAPLNGLGGAASQDACYLTFDFIPITNLISFNYVFGSEEYPEWVSSSYNDAFGFFLTGPGGYASTNIATLPVAGNPPVTIDNVNATTNSSYYINNTGGSCIQYDGMTTTLTASATVIPCSTYTITIAIADAGDGFFDSGVFFQENSFSAGTFAVNITSQTNATCATLGSATALATGGTAPYSYSWNTVPVQNTATATNLAPGTYTVTASYNICGNSVTATNTVTITGPTPFVPTATNGGPYCAGQTIQLNSPLGSSTDDWTGPGGYIQNNTQNPTRPISTVAMAGVYTVTSTNGAGCTGTATTTVVVNPLPTPTATNGGPYCAGATIQLNSPAGSSTDDWTGPNAYTTTNTQNPTLGPATAAMNGVYTVTVTNGSGCSATATTSVTVNPLPTPTATNGGPYCAGATIQLNSPTGSSTDDWTGPNAYTTTNAQNPTLGPATAAMNGVYTVTVTNGSGCSATATTSVTVNPLPLPTATNGGPYCVGATIQLNSPTGSSTDDWTGPNAYTTTNAQNPTLGPATAAMNGVYTVTVTNGSGCSATATTSVTVNPLPTPTATNGGPYCAGATIQLNSPAGSSTDDWTGPNAYTTTNTQNPTLGPATAAMNGVYTVTVTNGSGCSATATTSVTVNPLPLPTATNGGPYCAGATIQLNSPTGSSTDDWTGPNAYTTTNTQNPTLGPATAAMNGVYTVTVTNGSGCSATATTSVIVNPLPLPTATNGGPYCAGATIQLNSPTGSSTDDWAGPNAYTTTNTQNPTLGPATAVMNGVYTVTVTNGSGCSATATTSVTVNPLPTPTATNGGPYCSGVTIQLNSPTGSATDDWAGPGGYTSANNQNPTLSPATVAMSGVYTVTVTNGSGCSATATTTVTVNAAAIANANNTGPYCAGATINLNSGAGAIDYDWTGPGGYVVNNTQNPTIPGSGIGNAGIYTVTITQAGGCTGTATTTVVVNNNPTPTANNTGPYCAGASIQLNSPLGSATDDWTGPIGYTSTNTQNPVIGVSTTGMTGVYTVTVTDGNGCSATATTSVTINPLPTPTANNGGPYCAGATIQLNSPTGSGTDDWTGPSGYNQNNLQNPTITGSTTAMNGIYTVSVTDVNGCVATATTTVAVNPLPIPFANNTGPYCDGESMDLASSGGVDYDWSGPAGFVLNNTQNGTISNATPGMSGVYSVSVTDVNGCNSVTTTTVVVNALPTPLANNTGPYCSGSNMDLSSSGGVDYDWSGPAGFVLNDTQNGSVSNVNPGMSGAYTVSVTDANGCVSVTSTFVTINPLPVPLVNNNTPICEFQNLDLTANGGVIYDWTGPGGYNVINTQNPTITNAPASAAGIYTVTVTDVNGCISTATTTAIINSNLVFSAAGNSPICAGVQLDLTAQNIAGASYNWTGPNGFNVLNQQNPSIPGASTMASGTYTVLATGSTGCTGTATVNVLVNPVPTPQFTGDNLSGCAPVCVNFSDQSLGNGGTISNWTWNVEGQNASMLQNPSFCFDNAGNYDASLTVTTTDGCFATLSLINYITVYLNPIASFDFTPKEIDIEDPEVTFASTSTGATSWTWLFGDGATSSLENPIHMYQDTGVYCIALTISNSFGCTDTTSGCLYIEPIFNLFIPSAFSPNDDGLNETFNVYGTGVKTIVVRIFDRWGEELFMFDDMHKGWPGTRVNGEECKQDVYTYRVEVVDSKNDFHEYMGKVTLIR